MPIVNLKPAVQFVSDSKERGSNTDVLGFRRRGRPTACDRKRSAASPLVYHKAQSPGEKKTRPSRWDERAVLDGMCGVDQAACAFATTFLRHGLSTAIASSEARILAPAAITDTRSQVPEDCCISFATGTSRGAVPLAV